MLQINCDDDAVGARIFAAVLNPHYKALSFSTKNMRTASHDRVAFLVDEEKAKQQQDDLEKREVKPPAKCSSALDLLLGDDPMKLIAAVQSENCSRYNCGCY